MYQKKYKEEAEKTMPYYVPVADTPEMQRVRENQKNFSTVRVHRILLLSNNKKIDSFLCHLIRSKYHT